MATGEDLPHVNWTKAQREKLVDQIKRDPDNALHTINRPTLDTLRKEDVLTTITDAFASVGCKIGPSKVADICKILDEELLPIGSLDAGNGGTNYYIRTADLGRFQEIVRGNQAIYRITRKSRR